MTIRKPATPLAAAVAAAKEFKAMLDLQPADQLFWPIKGKRLLDSACYAEACSLLQQAISQDLQVADGVGFERHIAVPLAGVVADKRADVPPNPLQLFAGITAAIAQLAFQVLDESRGGTEHSGFLEIGIRFRSQVDQTGELVQGEGNAIHGSASNAIVEQALCHGGTNASEVQ